MPAKRRPTLHVHAAVDREVGTRDEARIVGAKKRDERCDLVGTPRRPTGICGRIRVSMTSLPGFDSSIVRDALLQTGKRLKTETGVAMQREDA